MHKKHHVTTAKPNFLNTAVTWQTTGTTLLTMQHFTL